MTKHFQILIVEDDEWLAEQCIRIFKGAGFGAEDVTSALPAMEAIDVRRPDILFLDVLLPGGTIFTLLHELRSDIDLAAIPVILCTNSGDQLASEDLGGYGVMT